MQKDYTKPLFGLKAKFFKFTYKALLKRVFFLLDPEIVHNLLTDFGLILGKYKLTRKFTSSLFRYYDNSLKQVLWGIEFENPVGLSAGFDKDAKLVDICHSVGFGFEEIGSITAKPYGGNPRPRLYRLKKTRGLVVYYGLKNLGVKKIIEKLKKRKLENYPLNISIAKTNSFETKEMKDGIEDYFVTYKQLCETKTGHMYTINISCPNTFGGEPFTTPEKLEALLKRLRTFENKTPLLVKMPINLEWEDFDKLLEVCTKYKIDGVIIGNLNKDRSSTLIKDKIPDKVKGGISGIPTKELSNNLIAKTYSKYGKSLIIIGVGGIFTAEDAYEKIKLGASLVELITGMIFEGPELIGEINYKLSQFLKRDGYRNISEAVGESYAKS